MKTATIDLGNTRGKLAIFNQNIFQKIYFGTITELNEIIKKEAPDAAIICSVVHSKSEASELFVNDIPTLYLNYDLPISIKNNYATPLSLGYDRLAAAAGAHFLFPQKNNLIVDLGTAIKYDYINNLGQFEGGIISPGLKMRFKALHTFTKKLPLLEPNPNPALIGTSTETCMQSGVVNGIAAEINGIIAEYLKKTEINVILTGGDASFFESKINYPNFAEPHLIPIGLNRILNYNVEQKTLRL